MVVTDSVKSWRPVHAGAVLTALLGSLSSLVGWAFLGLGLFLFWLSVYDIFEARILFDRVLVPGQAVVETQAVSYARVNKVPVIVHRYHFQHQGKDYTGQSYSTGKHLAPGLPVPIEFAADQPDISRLTLPGFRAAPHEDWVAYYVLALPILSLLLLSIGLFKGFRLLGLMRRGHVLTARIADSQPTGAHEKITGKPQPVYLLTLAYVVAGKTYQTRYKTWRPELIGALSPHVLIDSKRPEQAIALDDIGDRLYLDERGTFRARPRALTFLLVPGLFLLLNLVTIAFKFGFRQLP